MGCGTGGPGDTRMSTALPFPLMPTCPLCPPASQRAGTDTHRKKADLTLLTPGSRTRSGRWSLGASSSLPVQREVPSGPVWDVSPFSASHPGGGHGWEGGSLPALSPVVLLAAPEKFQSQRQDGTSFPYHMSLEPMLSVFRLPARSLGYFRAS